MTVSLNKKVPAFSRPATGGKTWKLADAAGKKLVLYFYPKDNTHGCTAEACAFRDSHEVFGEAGAEVIGISSDSVDSHGKFSSRHQLPFVLLSDKGGAIRKRYGVPTNLGILPGRVTYVIDRKGTVRHIFSSMTNIDQHIGDALAMVKQLQAEQTSL